MIVQANTIGSLQVNSVVGHEAFSRHGFRKEVIGAKEAESAKAVRGLKIERCPAKERRK